jgi:hypothetical protein
LRLPVSLPLRLCEKLISRKGAKLKPKAQGLKGLTWVKPVKYKIHSFMKRTNFKQYVIVAHHTGGALHHGIHRRHAGSAPVFVADHEKTRE